MSGGIGDKEKDSSSRAVTRVDGLVKQTENFHPGDTDLFKLASLN